MRLSSFFSLLVLDAIHTVSGTCLGRVSNNIMAVFSGAPFAFAMNYRNGSACAGYCEGLRECTAWLYSVKGGECQLYKTTALSTFTSQHFVYGICDGLHLPAASSSLVVVSATSPYPDPTPVASTTVSGKVSLHVCYLFLLCNGRSRH